MESQEAFEIIANTMVFFHLLVPQEIPVKSYIDQDFYRY